MTGAPLTAPGDGSRRRMPGMRMLMIMVVVVVALIIVIVAHCSHGSASEVSSAPAVSVRVAPVLRGTIAAEVSVVGAMVPEREATLSSRIAAPIARMDLLINRFVREGDVLAVLESRDLRAQQTEVAGALREAELAVRSTNGSAIPLSHAQDQRAMSDAAANVENARQSFERRRTLYEQGGISKKDLEASQLALTTAEGDLRLAEKSAAVHHASTSPLDSAMAEARVKQAAGRLAALDAQVSYARIRAPFSGVVTAQFQYQGEYASPGGKLLTIADTETLIVKIPVATEVASQLRAGDRAQVFPEDLAGRSIPGQVRLVSRAADPMSRTVEVWVMLANLDGRLHPYGTARVVVAARQQFDAVVVPAAAVTLDATNGSGGTVMTVDKDWVAHQVHVVTGIRTRAQMQILSGLEGGETVVIEGNYGLPDGTKVAASSGPARAATQPDRP